MRLLVDVATETCLVKHALADGMCLIQDERGSTTIDPSSEIVGATGLLRDGEGEFRQRSAIRLSRLLRERVVQIDTARELIRCGRQRDPYSEALGILRKFLPRFPGVDSASIVCEREDFAAAGWVCPRVLKRCSAQYGGGSDDTCERLQQHGRTVGVGERQFENIRRRKACKDGYHADHDVIAEPQPARHTYLGLFLVTLSTLMFEILLTRIFSVTMLYHFAFVALSLAMFGMTVGALIVYLLPGLFTAQQLRSRLAVASVLFPIAMVASFLTELSIPFRIHPSVVAVYAIFFTYAVLTIPFIVSGVIVCLALTGYAARVSRLYAADLAGAALGCVLLIPVLGYSDGPTAVLWTAAFASLGAIAFTRGSSGQLRALSVAVAMFLFLASAGHTVLVWKHFPIFRILYIKGSFEARPLYEKWNSYSRVRVNGDPQASVAPQGWGLSTTVPADLRVHQLQMDIDVVAGTVLTGYTGDPETVRHLGYDITNVAYRIRRDADALVIGAGGGRDVLSALTLGARSVTAVEINRDIIRTANGVFGDFTGHLDRDPRVRFINDEARSYIARSQDRYGIIQISLIDTWAATAAGAFVLSENSLYTTEAWTTFLRHLTPDGMLSVSRWYYRDRPSEMYRTTALAVEALRRTGVTNPRDYIVILRNMNLAYRPETPDGVGTLLVTTRPFSTRELAEIERTARDLRFEVMFTSTRSVDPTFDRLTGPDSRAFEKAYPLRIEAPTDDSPFFFNMLRWRDIFSMSVLEAGKQSNNLKAVATLGILLGTVLVLTVGCILVPLWMSRTHVPFAETRALLTFFICIGLGFMLVETSQMQRLIIALGHPTYALTVVLFALLLSSGLGSYMTRRIEPESAGPSGSGRLLLLVVTLASVGAATPAVVRATAAASTPVRIVAAVGLLFPAGLAMGMAFPLGMKLATRSTAALTPWLWGLNGAASVLASVLSICIALTWSISAAFWCGCLAYVIAFVAFRRAAVTIY